MCLQADPGVRADRNSVIALDGYTGVYTGPVPADGAVSGLREAGLCNGDGRRSGRYLRENGDSEPVLHELSDGSPPVGDCGKKNQVKNCRILYLANRKTVGLPGVGACLAGAESVPLWDRFYAYTGEATDSIVFFPGLNPSGEVSHIVHEIQRLVQEEKPAIGEIAVITGDLLQDMERNHASVTQNQIPFYG